MKKFNYFKIGASFYMLLGALHLIYLISTPKRPQNVMQMYLKMERTTFDFMGEHTVMQFYTGFSVMMGFMFLAFRFQLFMIKQSSKPVIFANIFLSLIASIIAVIYFHPLAYTCLLSATFCFILSFINSNNRP
ncbi:LIC_13387 family protein [Chryseobacterium sp. KMC2]|uniref:LIC_13387 family protein n=1 Tax=Chryseobacterium sp. KMC2 TaxID=2800705 RepID=UPI00397CC323